MNIYDFDQVHNRRNTVSVKWNVVDGELPMWVADMDFAIAPEIMQAMRKRIEHGIFGYTEVPDSWRESYGEWWRNRHLLELERDWIIFSTGVVPAISSMVRKLTTPGEKVLIQTPVYNVFFNSIVNNGRFVMESELRYSDGVYQMDMDDLEAKLADPQVTLMILCNPHNPIGRVWSREELARVGELCWKYSVAVISDEIHCDLTEPGVGYVPFISASPACAAVSVTCIAPTKAFNLAGLQTAAVVVPNETLRHKVNRALNTDEVAEPNVFACLAAEVAWREGGAWLDELREYLKANRSFADAFIKKELPAVTLVPAQATYLLWIDCRSLSENTRELSVFIRERTGLILCAGEDYGCAGKGFLRMNIACPRTRLEEGLVRLRAGLDAWRRGRCG